MEKRKKILLTGANGLLGQKVSSIFLQESNHLMTLTDLNDTSFLQTGSEYFPLNLTFKDDVKKFINTIKPDMIINTAAFTNVDACETERELSWRVNVDAVKNLLIACRINKTKLIHISTDYVFDGKRGNYDETSTPNPLSFYGKGKLAAENAILSSGVENTIIRTMILYGTGVNLRLNFALWLIENLKNKKPVTIVDDQHGQPTIIDDLAIAILRIVDRNCSGIYHVSGSEYINRYKFAIKLAEIFKFDKSLIIPIKTSELKQPAARPMNSSFITLKAQTELGLNPLNVTEGLYLLKSQLNM